VIGPEDIFQMDSCFSQLFFYWSLIAKSISKKDVSLVDLNRSDGIFVFFFY